MTSIKTDPFSLGNYFKLEEHPELNVMWSKTKLIATPILNTATVMGVSNDPLVSYIKITLDPVTHILKVALYFKASNASKIQVGVQQQTKDPTLLKRVISNHSDINGPFRELFISYFQNNQDQNAIGRVFRGYDLLKQEEVPVVCPAGLSMIYYARKAAKIFNNLTN